MQDSTNLSFGITLPFMVRCMLPGCGHAQKRVYRVSQDQYSLTFCSPDHARIGISRWEEKRKLGIKPGQPIQKEEEPEMMGDNLDSIEEGD